MYCYAKRLLAGTKAAVLLMDSIHVEPLESPTEWQRRPSPIGTLPSHNQQRDPWTRLKCRTFMFKSQLDILLQRFTIASTASFQIGSLLELLAAKHKQLLHVK